MMRGAAARYAALDRAADLMLAGEPVSHAIETAKAAGPLDLSETHEQILQLVDDVLAVLTNGLAGANVPPQFAMVLRLYRRMEPRLRVDFAAADPAPMVAALHELGRRCSAIGLPAEQLPAE